MGLIFFIDPHSEANRAYERYWVNLHWKCVYEMYFLCAAILVMFDEPSYTFNEDDGTVSITVVKAGNSDEPFTIRVTGGMYWKWNSLLYINIISAYLVISKH